MFNVSKILIKIPLLSFLRQWTFVCVSPLIWRGEASSKLISITEKNFCPPTWRRNRHDWFCIVSGWLHSLSNLSGNSDQLQELSRRLENTFDVALRQHKSQPEHSLTWVSTRNRLEMKPSPRQWKNCDNKNEKWHLKHFPPSSSFSSVCLCGGQVAESKFI